jgi:hypothetical protein
MRRVLAVVGALLMVAVALVVRSIVDDDGDAASGPDGTPVSLICAEELAEVCEIMEDDHGADVVVEPVGATVDRLGQPATRLDADGWLTLEPFAEQVDVRRGAAGGSALFGESHPTGHSTGLALVAFDDRAAALEAECDVVGWACLGTIAGEDWADHGGQADWGTVKVGYDDPGTSASGLLVLAQAMADHLDEPRFASQDIDDRWLGDLDAAVPNRPAGSVLVQLVQQGRAAFGGVGALGNPAEGLAATDRGRELRIFYPDPMFRATVVLSPAPGTDLSDFATGDALAEALADAGWERDVNGVPPPSGGVLEALQRAWVES